MEQREFMVGEIQRIKDASTDWVLLPPGGITEEQIVDLLRQGTAQTREGAIHQLIGTMALDTWNYRRPPARKQPKPQKSFDELVAERRLGGLTQEQAEQAVEAQAAHDGLKLIDVPDEPEDSRPAFKTRSTKVLEKLVAEKRAAGLPPAEAEQAALAQMEHDKRLGSTVEDVEAEINWRSKGASPQASETAQTDVVQK